MAANNDPIYSKNGDVQSSGSSALIAAVNASLYNAAGTIGTDVYKVWQADASNGGYLQRVRVKYVANATTASNACVMKFFISSATSGAVTDTNSFFYDDLAIPTTSTLTTTAGNVSYDMLFNFALPAGWTVLVKITVAQPASCGFVATGIGGAY
jgi:hypothetical protein